MSLARIDRGEIGQFAIRRSQHGDVLELELLGDVAHPAFAERFPGQHRHRRGPSSDHSAISTAPVSEAGTMPMR